MRSAEARVTAGSAPSVDRWRASTTPGICTSAPIATARSGAPGATRPTSSAPACDRSRSSMPRSPRTGSHSTPASTRWAGDVHAWIRYVQAMKPTQHPTSGHKASPPMAPIVRDACPVRPAFVPRTTGRRQEAMSAAEQQNAQVIGRIGASLQVPEVTPKTLSRWKHGSVPWHAHLLMSDVARVPGALPRCYRICHSRMSAQRSGTLVRGRSTRPSRDHRGTHVIRG